MTSTLPQRFHEGQLLLTRFGYGATQKAKVIRDNGGEFITVLRYRKNSDSWTKTPRRLPRAYVLEVLS